MGVDNYKFSKPFRTHLSSNSLGASDLVGCMLNLLWSDIETQVKRASKKKHQENLLVLLLNLFSAYTISPKCYLAYSRDKNFYNSKNRYRNGKLSFDVMMRLVNLLESAGYIDETKNGNYDRVTGKGYRSRTRSTPKLVNLFKQFKLTSFDIEHEVYEEVLLLRDEQEDGRKVLIDYKNTNKLSKCRKNLNRINRALWQTLINLHIEDKKLPELKRKLRRDPDRQPIDHSRRKLRRIFNGDFERGGRFYHGWWQELPKRYRKYLEIDGFKTVEIDYSAFHPQMVYQDITGTLFVGDPYLIDGATKSRDLAKLCFNAMLNADDKNAAILGIIDRDRQKNKGKTNLTEAGLRDVMNQLEKLHIPIADAFYSDLGIKLQRRDSDIAERIMLNMLDDGIIVLPIHDSFIVPFFAEKQVIDQMLSVPKELFGYEFSLDAKPTEMKEINSRRKSKNEEELTDGAFHFIHEDDDKKKYKQYYKIQKLWSQRVTL